MNSTPILFPSINQSSVLALLAFIESKGFSEDQLQQKAGIDLTPVHEQDGRLALEDNQRLWLAAIELTGVESLGLEIGRQNDPSNMGLVGHLIYNSNSMMEGLEHYIRLFSLVNSDIKVTMEEDRHYCYLHFRHSTPGLYCQPDMERQFALALHRTRALVNQNFCLRAVYFEHKRPRYMDAYRKVFNCPIYFGQDDCKIVFDRKFLQLQPRQRNPYLVTATMQYANALLKKLMPESFTDKVKALVQQQLESVSVNVGNVAQRAGRTMTQPIHIDQIAAALNMSRQTLYRKLKLEGISFQSLVEMARLNKAKQLLADSRLPLSEIAFALGFSELSAFSRAFKRWTGLSPKAFRESLA